MPSYDQNVEAPVNSTQPMSNPGLLNEGYPGISSPQTQTNFQPTSDGSTMSSSSSGNAMLNGLSKDVLLGTITNLPQQDIAVFFSGLPQNEQTAINTYIQQNPNAQGQDLFNQLSQLPSGDLAQGLALVPGADLQQALAAAQQGTVAAGADSSTSTTYGATGAGTDASGLYTQPSTATGDTSGLYTQQAPVGDTSGLSTQQSPVGTDTSGMNTQMGGTGTDTSGLATQPQVPSDGSGQLASGGGQNAPTDSAGGPQPGSTDNSAALNKLATLNSTQLGNVIAQLPQQDLAKFFQALPSDDQKALQSALANNNNPSAQDIAAAMSKLPTRDVLAAAGAVPGADFASLIPSDAGSQSASNQAPKPGGSEFPLLFGLGTAGVLGYVGYRRGLFNNAPDMFQRLTGRFDMHAPSWMNKLKGLGGGSDQGAAPQAGEPAVTGEAPLAGASEVKAATGVVEPMSSTISETTSSLTGGLDTASEISKGAEALTKAGEGVTDAAAILEHAGPVATAIEDGIEVAKVAH